MTAPPDDFAARVLEAAMAVKGKKSRTRWGGTNFQTFLTKVLLKMRRMRIPGRENFFFRLENQSVCGVCTQAVAHEEEHDHLELHWKQARFILVSDAENPGWAYTNEEVFPLPKKEKKPNDPTQHEQAPHLHGRRDHGDERDEE